MRIRNLNFQAQIAKRRILGHCDLASRCQLLSSTVLHLSARVHREVFVNYLHQCFSPELSFFVVCIFNKTCVSVYVFAFFVNAFVCLRVFQNCGWKQLISHEKL